MAAVSPAVHNWVHAGSQECSTSHRSEDGADAGAVDQEHICAVTFLASGVTLLLAAPPMVQAPRVCEEAVFKCSSDPDFVDQLPTTAGGPRAPPQWVRFS